MTRLRNGQMIQALDERVSRWGKIKVRTVLVVMLAIPGNKILPEDHALHATAASDAKHDLKSRCEALQGERLPHTTITAARVVNAGPFKLANMPTEQQVPSHCPCGGPNFPGTWF